MKKNVVLIETIGGTGSGILYPCKYNDKNIKEDVNYYIVFTNMHVLKDIQEESKPNCNIKDLIFLQIYDDVGNLIEEDNIISVISFCPKIESLNKTEDIGALLIAIKETTIITLDANIYLDNLSNRELIYLEGYPGIMLDDDVSQKIQLQGLVKNAFPESKKIGIFQITDDYHWYNNLYDLDLFRGMSGGPVYREYEGRTFLIGMIQSVSVLEEGQNPFKLVYYLRMEFILEYLRSAGCIIFRKVGKVDYLVEWVFGMENEINTYTNNPSFLLIGGSGAGKSSFAKSFAYNGDNLLTTNDGQTTRTTIAYEYSIFCKQPKVKIEFMNQEEFCEYMSSLQGTKPILRLITKLYKLDEDLVKNEAVFLNSIYYFLDNLKDCNEELKNMIPTIEEYQDANRRYENLDTKDMIKIYERIIVFLIRYIPNQFVKYIFDIKWIESIRKQYQESYEKQYCKEDERKKWLDEIIAKANVCNEVESDVEYISILREYISSELNLQKYQKKVIDYIFNKEKCSELEYEKKIDIIKSLDIFKLEYLKELLYVDGFFNVKEFLFLNGLNGYKYTEELEVNIFSIEKSKKNISEDREDFEFDFWEGIQNVYKSIYKKIKKAICEEYNIYENDFKREFNLSAMNDKSRKELQLCLQVNLGKSLTGIIKKVKIDDMISNEYAMILSELKIARIRMYDTFGLDHVEGMKNVENILYSHVYKINENDGIRYKDINVLYFKKLDAGRPDELKIVLPSVRKVIPQAPVYCVFTGIDIFYKTPEEVRNLQWKVNNEKIPKSVRFVLSENGRSKFVNNGEYGNIERNKNMYLVLRNNLIPFCGDKEKVQNEYDFMKNNEIYVKKMLASIVMKEYSSLEIVELEQFIDLDCDIYEEIKAIITEMFKRASVNISGIHWNTIRANIRSMSKDKKLGAWTSYRYQWNQRFHEGYAYAIDKLGAELANQFDGSKDAIESALKNVEDSFLGTAENLYKIDITSDKKNNFRKYMEDMYEDALYEYNPYITTKEQFEKILENNEERKKYFKDVFDFAKGIKNNENLLNKFANEFVDKLYEELDNDNKTKAENIIYLNASFSDSVEEMRNEFIKKYKLEEDDENKVEENFKRILQAYIESI